MGWQLVGPKILSVELLSLCTCRGRRSPAAPGRVRAGVQGRRWSDPEEKPWAPRSCARLSSAPARLIAKNAGVDGDVIIEKLLGTSFNTGYNAVRLLPCCHAVESGMNHLDHHIRC